MKKGIIAAIAGAAAVVVLGGGGFWLAKSVISFGSIAKNNPHFETVAEDYPFGDTEVPEYFKEASIKGVDFMAPVGLEWKNQYEDSGIDAGILVDDLDVNKCTLTICALDADTPSFQINEIYDEKTIEKMKKDGFDTSGNYYRMMKDLYQLDPEKCNKFSISDVKLYSELAEAKELLGFSTDIVDSDYADMGGGLLADDGVYIWENDNINAIVHKYTTKNNKVEFIYEVFDGASPNTRHLFLIQCNAPLVAEQVACKLKISEE